MAVIVAVNFKDRLVLLEDGRELPITRFYSNRTYPHRGPLKAGNALLASDRVEGPEDAEVFTVDIPGAGTSLIVEMGALQILQPGKAN